MQEIEALEKLAETIERLDTLELVQFALAITALLLIFVAGYAIYKSYQVATQANVTAQLNAKVAYMLSLHQRDTTAGLTRLESDIATIRQSQIEDRYNDENK